MNGNSAKGRPHGVGDGDALFAIEFFDHLKGIKNPLGDGPIGGSFSNGLDDAGFTEEKEGGGVGIVFLVEDVV